MPAKLNRIIREGTSNDEMSRFIAKDYNDVMEFETAFASSPLSSEYSNLFVQITFTTSFKTKLTLDNVLEIGSFFQFLSIISHIGGNFSSGSAYGIGLNEVSRLLE